MQATPEKRSSAPRQTEAEINRSQAGFELTLGGVGAAPLERG
jgi:hypothetical protein